MKKRTYAVIGSGALGGLYGGLLARAGHEVHFLFHRDYDHVCEQGLRVESVFGDFHLRDVNAHSTASSMPECDVTMLALKTTKNHLLGDLLPTPCGNQGGVLCLQNGLNVERDSAAIVGRERVLGGCCFLCSNKVGPGHIRHIDQGRVVFGNWAEMAIPASDFAISICEDLAAAGIRAKTTDDLPRTRWQKLLWNIPFNGLSVVLDASTKLLIENQAVARLAKNLMVEIREAAIACGVSIEESMIDKTLEATRVMVPYDSSMRLDYLARRPLEIQAIFSNPIEEAKRQGFEMKRTMVLRDQLEFLNRTAT